MLSPSSSVAAHKAVCPDLGYLLNDFLDGHGATCQARSADRNWSPLQNPLFQLLWAECWPPRCCPAVAWILMLGTVLP